MEDEHLPMYVLLIVYFCNILFSLYLSVHSDCSTLRQLFYVAMKIVFAAVQRHGLNSFNSECSMFVFVRIFHVIEASLYSYSVKYGLSSVKYC